MSVLRQVAVASMQCVTTTMDPTVAHVQRDITETDLLVQVNHHCSYLYIETKV